jgi:hypothetical protein
VECSFDRKCYFAETVIFSPQQIQTMSTMWAKTCPGSRMNRPKYCGIFMPCKNYWATEASGAHTQWESCGLDWRIARQQLCERLDYATVEQAVFSACPMLTSHSNSTSYHVTCFPACGDVTQQQRVVVTWRAFSVTRYLFLGYITRAVSC